MPWRLTPPLTKSGATVLQLAKQDDAAMCPAATRVAFVE